MHGGDIFTCTWTLCYNRLVAAMAMHSKFAQAKTIVQDTQQFKGVAGGCTIRPSGYRQQQLQIRIGAHSTSPSRPISRWTGERMCAGSAASASTPCNNAHGMWTHLYHIPSQATFCWPRSLDTVPQICHSWDAGTCRCPTSCNFQHICSVCHIGFDGTHPQ